MSVLPDFENLKNTRDLGGMRTRDGQTVRPGLFIRSGNLAGASPRDVEFLGTLVSAVVDFRTDKERAEHPDPAIPGAAAVHLPAAREYMRNTYRAFAESPAALKGYSAFVRLLCGEREGAVLWHCTAGKDRAGFAAVIAEEALGVDRAQIRADYLYTNTCLAEDIETLTERAQREFGMKSPEAEAALLAMFSADISYLDAVYERIGALWGGFDGYLRDALGMTEDMCEALRRRCLD